MNMLSYIQSFERIHQFIRRKATGTPQDLADRLEIPKRNLHRLLNDMKNFGFPIQYCKQRQSYYYTNEVRFNFEMKVIDDKETTRTKGGIFFNFFEKNKFSATFWHSGEASL